VLLGLAAIAAIGLVRLAMIMAAGGLPTGSDPGNWLAFGSIDRPGMVYPPLVPALFAALVSDVGIQAGGIAFMLASTTAPALSVVAVLAWARRPVAAALAGAAVAAARANGEAAAWGGYPQPLAMAALLVSLPALIVFLRDGSRRALAVFAVSAWAVVATSHLVAIPAAVAWGLAVTGMVAAGRVNAPRIAAAAAIAAVPFALLSQVYMALLRSVPGGVSSAVTVSDVLYVLGLSSFVYLAVAIVLLFTLLALALRPGLRDRIPARSAIVLGSTAAAAGAYLSGLAVTHQPRLLHDTEVIAILAIAALGALMPAVGSRTARLLALILVEAMAIGLLSGLASFRWRLDYYRVLTPGGLAALEWSAAHGPPGDREVLVGDMPVSRFNVGWWADGILRRETLFATDPRYVRFPTEQARVAAADALLYSGGDRALADARSLRAAGVREVVLAHASSWRVSASSPPAGMRVVFAAGDAVVLDVAP
jgi:hypothetical protein